MKAKTALAVLGMVVLAVAGCGTSTEVNTAPVDVRMTLDIEPNPPSVGESTLVITLVDARGHAIEGATLHVNGNMAHEGMAPVAAESHHGQDGHYTVPFNWTMGGGWTLEVTATLPETGAVVAQSFDVEVNAVSANSIIHERGHDSVTDGESQNHSSS